MPRAIDFAFLFVTALAFASMGWVMVVLTSHMERWYQELHPEEPFSSAPTKLPAWAQFVHSWLLPERPPAAGR
jgi:hypothetical protein